MCNFFVDIKKGTIFFFNLRLLLYTCSIVPAFRRMLERNVFTPACLFTGGYPLSCAGGGGFSGHV